MSKRNERLRLAPLGAAMVLLLAAVALADDAPTPAASSPSAPSLAVSDKAPPGCCCITPDAAAGAKPGCTYGLSEDKCRIAGHVAPKWASTWAPGKCPAP